MERDGPLAGPGRPGSVPQRQSSTQAAEALAGFTIDRIVSSDLSRASRTAGIVAERLGVTAIGVDEGLREVDVGEWSGLTRPEIEGRWPKLLAAWSDGTLQERPGGESLDDLRTRVTEAIRKVLRASPHGAARPFSGEAERGSGGQTILVVSHRRAISALEETTESVR